MSEMSLEGERNLWAQRSNQEKRKRYHETNENFKRTG
jgi:hypothetical protein